MTQGHHRLVLAACLAAAAFGQGCRTSPGGDAASESGGAMPEDPRADVTSLKEARYLEAVAGIDFRTGLVVVTEPLAGGRAAAQEYLDEGLDKLDENRRTGALSSLTRAVRSDPQWPAAHDALGVALRNKGKDREALAAFRTAVTLDPEFVEARYHLAATLARLGRHAEAIDEMLVVVDLDPTRGDAHERLAIWSYYAGDRDAARRHADAAENLGRTLPPQFVALLEEEN